MPKSAEFIALIHTLKAISPTITDQQRVGLLRQAVNQYGLRPEDAEQILGDLGLIIGESTNYFEALGLSILDLQAQSESAIAAQVDTAHKKCYSASLSVGGRVRPDGKTEEQWRIILNRARDTLKNPQKRQAHIALLQPEKTLPAPEPTPSSIAVPDDMVIIPAGEFQMGTIGVNLGILQVR